jgi:hypothetical protein
MKKVGLLWVSKDSGLYSNRNFDDIYDEVGFNNGNLAFVYAIEKSIENPIQYFPWGTPAEVINKYCDIAVMPCANQLGSHADLGDLGERFSRYNVPIVAIGLGAQAENIGDSISLCDGTKFWVEQINEHKNSSQSNIYTRGKYTSIQLDLLGITGTVVGGCPSHFINGSRSLGVDIEKKWSSIHAPGKISVAAGHESWKNLTAIENQLVQLINDPIYPGQYVVQSMEEMVKISRNEFSSISKEAMQSMIDYIAPHYSVSEFKSWCKSHAYSFYNIPAWMDSLRRFDVSIGTRYHGVALAIQAGAMGITIAIDSRTEEMCIQTGVPYVRASEIINAPITRKIIKEKLINFDGEKYDAHRSERAKNYADFLVNNGLTPSRNLMGLI